MVVGMRYITISKGPRHYPPVNNQNYGKPIVSLEYELHSWQNFHSYVSLRGGVRERFVSSENGSHIVGYKLVPHHPNRVFFLPAVSVIGGTLSSKYIIYIYVFIHYFLFYIEIPYK